jgi:hypothetical protein
MRVPVARSLVTATLLSAVALLLAASARAATPVNTTNVCKNPSPVSDKANGDYFDTCVSGASFTGDKKPFK